MARYFRGHALANFTFRFWIDQETDVGMAVGIDESRGDGQPRRLDDAVSRTVFQIADRCDSAVSNAQVGRKGFSAQAVVNRSSLNDEVKFSSCTSDDQL